MRRGWFFFTTELSNSIAYDKWAQAHNLFEPFSKTFIYRFEISLFAPTKHAIDHQFSHSLKRVYRNNEMIFFRSENEKQMPTKWKSKNDA